MSRNWQLYWRDIQDSVAKILRYTDGMAQYEFIANDLVRDAVLRNLEIIGEAAKQIPPEARARYNSVDWKRITGFRDVIAHAYFGIDDAILWNIVSIKVPELQLALKHDQ